MGSMTANEIYVLNRALDGRDIYSLPPLAGLGLSEVLITSVKDKLIQKNVLKDHDSFTDIGVVLTNRLLQFKNAKKHISIGTVKIGTTDDSEGTLLIYNPYLDAYKIETADLSTCVKQIISAYKFLENCNNENPVEAVWEMDINSVKDKYKFDSSNSFMLTTHSAEKSDTKELFFKSNNALYIYDCVAEILKLKSRAGALEFLAERIGASWES